MKTRISILLLAIGLNCFAGTVTLTVNGPVANPTNALWGFIGGSIASQADLAAALNLKATTTSVTAVTNAANLAANLTPYFDPINSSKGATNVSQLFVNLSPMTNAPRIIANLSGVMTPPALNWSGLSTSFASNGIAARIPVWTNSGTIYYLLLATNVP